MPTPIRFEPTAYVKGKARCRQIQTDCLGFHAPELRALCGPCAGDAIELAARTERERIACFAESQGQPALAELIRNLE